MKNREMMFAERRPSISNNIIAQSGFVHPSKKAELEVV